LREARKRTAPRQLGISCSASNGEGWFVGPNDRTLGVWIASESIASLEIYELDGAVNLERESPKIRS
jgi:hypothetical protein